MPEPNRSTLALGPNALVRRLEQLWQGGQQPDPVALLESAGPCPPDVAAAVFALDQWQRWHAGRRVAAEDYLRRWPALAAAPEAAVDLIYGEFLVRQGLGERPAPAEYLDRFPAFADGLRKQFELFAAVEGDSRATHAVDPAAATLAGAPTPAVPEAPAVPGYDLLGEVGRGGMGVVYKARQTALGRVVALKMLRHGQLADPRAVERFHEEARSAATLDHPHIVPIYEVGTHGDCPYFTMAFVEGTSLRALAGADRRPAADVAAVVAAVADAVQFAHDHGVLHRDLKPDNVLIDRGGRPRVTDFGLAKWLDGGPGLTVNGELLGTPAYMAPEQACGDVAAVGPASDVYGLGGILYFLLTGRDPFRGANLTEVLLQVMGSAPVPPRQHNPAVPAELEAVCLKCLEKKPADRYASAAAVAAAVRGAVGQPGPPGPATAAGHALPTPAPGHSRRRWLVPAAAGLTVLGVGAWLALRPPASGVIPPADPAAGEGAAPPATELPPPARHDFRLKVEMLGGRPGADGVLRLVAGQEVRFRIEVERDAYVGLWTFDPRGRARQLFPNESEPDYLLRAGRPRTVPGGDYTIVAEVGGGVEQVRVIASSRPWDLRLGQKEGPFRLFPAGAERARLEQELRGLVLRPKTAVAEEALKYEVGPRP